MSDWTNDLDWDAFVAHHREQTVKQMHDSAFVLQIVPSSDDVDLKFAVELGVAILLDKPIMAVLQPGATAPGKLLQVADEVVHADIDVEEGREALQAAIGRMLARQEQPK